MSVCAWVCTRPTPRDLLTVGLPQAYASASEFIVVASQASGRTPAPPQAIWRGQEQCGGAVHDPYASNLNQPQGCHPEHLQETLSEDKPVEAWLPMRVCAVGVRVNRTIRHS